VSTVGKGCGGLGKTNFYSMCGQVLLAAGGPARAPRRARATRMLEDAVTRRHPSLSPITLVCTSTY
jgi:hypothetical protein